MAELKKKKPSNTECCSCTLFFSGPTAFSIHRTGSFCKRVQDGKITHYYPGDRRCMNASEMSEAGLVLRNDVWGFPPPEGGMQFRKQV